MIKKLKIEWVLPQLFCNCRNFYLSPEYSCFHIAHISIHTSHWICDTAYPHLAGYPWYSYFFHICHLEFCNIFSMVVPPFSTTLNLIPASLSFSATSLSIFACSLSGVDGSMIGSMNPPFVAQFLFLLFLCYMIAII